MIEGAKMELRITIELVGGSLDGDSVFIQPKASVSLPQQLRYLSANGKEAIWEIYENTSNPVIWDQIEGIEQVKRYQHIGSEPVL